MSRACDVCGKGIQFGNKVSHAHNVSHRVWNPNLQRVHVVVGGTAKTLRVCTRCLRTGLVNKKARKPGKAKAATA
jgi:large subunit ribosomal protein L28